MKSFFFTSQLNSRYREGYDRHDTVKGTRESVNTPVKNHGQEQYRKCGVKENQEVITIPRLSKKAKREWSLFLDLRTGRRSYCTPSLSQAIQLKLLSQSGNLDIYTIFDILTQRKPNQQEKISFRTEDVRKFFPKSYTTAQMQDVILRLLEGYQRQRQRSQER